MTNDELALAANTDHAAIVDATASMLEHARHAGDLLLQLKARLGHGNFGMFVRDKCTFSVRTAEAYMQIASHWTCIEANPQRAADLSIRAALAFIRKQQQQEEKDEALERPAPGVFWKDLKPEEQSEVRRIMTELDEFPFVPRTFVSHPDTSGFEVVAGTGGAKVYYDILGGDPVYGPYFRYSRPEVRHRLHAFIDGGPRNVVTDLTVDVARRRIAGDRSVSAPSLPLDRGATTVMLDADRVVKCERLAQPLLTMTIEETVGRAIDYAAERLLEDDDASPTAPTDDLPACFATLTTADLSDPIGAHDEDPAPVTDSDDAAR